MMDLVNLGRSLPSPIRQFPGELQRVETGTIQFGNDWPGVFIRGGNAAHYALHLRAMMDAFAAAGLDSYGFSLAVVDDLLGALEASRAQPTA